MNQNHGTLFYIDHAGIHKNFNDLSINTVFVPDANVAIKIIEKNPDPQLLDLVEHLREIHVGL
jgi:hypothetical protein